MHTLSRRQFLGAGSLLAAGVLAGCGGAPAGGDGSMAAIEAEWFGSEL